MKKFLFLTAVFITGLTCTLFAQNNIKPVRYNNSQGIPEKDGETITNIYGIVIAGTEFGTNGPGFMQDDSAGIGIYGSGFTSGAAIGDSIRIARTTITHYNGLTQFDFTQLGVMSVLSSGNKIDTLIVTLSQINNQAWNGFEQFEGRLVRVNGVTINTGSSSFRAGNNYTISDGTASLSMRIQDAVSSIDGLSIPNGEIDVVGVVGQFDSSNPRSSGYQLLPRFVEDLNIKTPKIIEPVVTADVTENSFSVYFRTTAKGNTKIQYGETTGLEIGQLSNDEDTTFHSITIAQGIQPDTKYYFRVSSENDFGTENSSVMSVTTSDGSLHIGEINVYFNRSVDNSVAIPGNEALGNVDINDYIINRINSAVSSIDVAIYSFQDQSDIADALIIAHLRGVQVRVVYDNRDNQNNIVSLINEGIPVIKRPADSYIMHNKFAIFDVKDEDPNNNWLWTGSSNWTENEIDQWYNNSLEICDTAITEAYTIEFEEMFGSSTAEPNPSNAKFGNNKTDNTPHYFNIGGREVIVSFSPSDGTENYIIDALGTADSSVYFSLLTITSNGIFSEMQQQFNSGVNDMRGIINTSDDSGTEYDNLDAFVDLWDFPETFTVTLHHKYALIDASYITSDPTVITGSHNWTAAANQNNDENTIIIKDKYIANKYLQEFKERYDGLAGNDAQDFPVPNLTSVEDLIASPNQYQLMQNYPNPFNPETKIAVYIPERTNINLSVYNLLGQMAAQLFNGEVNSGIQEFRFDASEFASGVYIYRLTAPGVNISKKMILIK